jgi:hypothetical protein
MIPFHVSIQGNERADVLANKRSIFGTLQSWYCYAIVPRVSIEAWVATTVDKRVFLVAMSRLMSNHTGTRAHLQRINVVQDALY